MSMGEYEEAFGMNDEDDKLVFNDGHCKCCGLYSLKCFCPTHKGECNSQWKDRDKKKLAWIEPSEASRERLYVLAEELGEAQQIAMKVLRFGWHEFYTKVDATNKARLESELGDVLAMISLLIEKGDIGAPELLKARELKYEKLKRYTKHQGL